MCPAPGNPATGAVSPVARVPARRVGTKSARRLYRLGREAGCPGVAFVPEAFGQDSVEFGAPAFDPAPSGGQWQEFEIQTRDDHIVAGCGALGDDPAVGIDDHGVAGAYFVVVAADPIAEDDEDAVVMGP